METAKIVYEADLRCEATHILSKTRIITDAPPDNNGKGSSFSPTDLLSTSLACCMITIMGIRAEKHRFNLGKIESSVVKVMGTDPRRVIEIRVELKFTERFTNEQTRMLEEAALNCPVAKSLHPDIRQEVKFIYPH